MIKLKGFRALLLSAAIVTFLLMVVGNAVRVGNANQGCPDWPLCYGQWTLTETVVQSAADPGALYLQYAHRVLAVLSTLLVLSAAAWAGLRYRTQPWMVGSLATAGLLMVGQGFMGSQLVQAGSAAWVSAVHMGVALIALALTVAAGVASFSLREDADAPVRLSFRAPFARLAGVTLAFSFILLVNGTLVTAAGAGTACMGWPLCDGSLPDSGLTWLAFSHRLVVLASGLLVTVQFIQAWKGQRSQVVALPAATGVFVLMVGQVFIGAVKVINGFPADLVGLHAASAAGLWAVQVVVWMAAGLARRSAQDEAAERAEPLSLRSRARDFLLLNKPIIVVLLLVTTYAGMVVGGREIPSLTLTFWTMLGGALAAGGSSALNQYIDRETDRAMQRTAQRPLPGGRLKPAEALAYGLAAVLASFFLLAGTVNLLAAVLSLAGMIYYVLIYSVWLKYATVQNIVIGGGAGAIPPLVGWAAATGSLNVPSLFLFAIIFLWTPPHFWALALVRSKDYARGKVPMLPVIRGEQETRKQILIYTLELVALTLLLPIFKMSGTVYLVSAVALGGWLIHTAWKVYKSEGNKMAFRMYRYSSMYLAFLMLAMVIDVLV
jgi:heme o synthase